MVRALRGTWRYENYGTTDLLLPEVQAETVEVDIEKSLTGYAYKNPYLRARQFDIPTTDEIWIKFDFYVTNLENDRLFVGNFKALEDPYSDIFGAALFFTYYVSITTWGASPYPNSLAFDHETVDLSVFQGKLCRALLHMKSDATNGQIDITISGGYNFSVVGNVNNGEEFERICITTMGSKQVSDPEEFLISNVIISNSPLQLSDDVATLSPLREVTADFDLIRDTLGVWRYENEGRAELLLSGIEGITEQVDINKSRTGYGYYIDDTPILTKYFGIYNTSEIWIKFDFYCETEKYGHSISVGSKDNFGVNGAEIKLGKFNKTSNCQILANNEKIKLSSSDYEKNLGAIPVFKIHRALLHMKSATEDGIIELFLDNGNYANYTGNVNNGLEFGNVYIAAGKGYENNPLISNIIISNTPVRLYEDISTLVYPGTFTFDLIRDTLGVWRYENYGTANLLTVLGTTITDLPAEKSKTGSAFYQTQRARCFDTSPTHEVWIKFDFYSDTESNKWVDETNYFYVGNISDDDKWGAAIKFRPKSSEEANTTDLISNVASNGKSFALSGNRLYTCILHMKSGFYDGLAELSIGGEKVISLEGNVNNSKPFEKLTFFSEDGITLFSNVVISNAELDFFDDYRKGFFFSLCRNVVKSIVFDCDIARVKPFAVSVSAIEHAYDEPWPEQDTTGIQSIEIRLEEQQLTDELTCVSIIDFAPLDYVKGKYLDYDYSIRAERIIKQGVMTTCQFCSDIDEILYSQIDYEIPENEQWHRIDAQTPQEEEEPMANASTHMNTIANALGKQLIFQCTDFVSTIDVESGGMTYNDLIRDIFGWTARIPSIMVNCYLRAGNLFVIQRGHEANVIDLTNTNHSKPTIEKKIVRMTWGSKPNSTTEVREVMGTRWKALTKPFTATSNDNKKNYTYDNDGLVKSVSTHGEDAGTYTTTNYEYQTLKNGRKFLHREITEVYENYIRVDYRVTEHEPLQQGQEHVIARDEDGGYLGDVMGRGTNDDRISAFTSHMYINGQKQLVTGYRQEQYVQYKEQRTLNGIALIDTSFPVHGDDMLAAITDCIKWMDRKIQETVTMEIRNYNHLIDFNDRIIFEGNVYYLQSNTATKTPRINNKQSLSFVRWY